MSASHRIGSCFLAAAAWACAVPVGTLQTAIPEADPVAEELLGSWDALRGDDSSGGSNGPARVVIERRLDGGEGYRLRIGSGDDERLFHGRAATTADGILFETVPDADVSFRPEWARPALIPIRTPLLLRLVGDTLDVRIIGSSGQLADSLAAAGIPWTPREGSWATGRIIVADSASLRRHMLGAFEAVGELAKRYVRVGEVSP